jgi:Zn-dependent protease
MSEQQTAPLQSGSLQIFSLAGIRVFVHWSWLLAAYFLINWDDNAGPVWKVLEYVGLFGIVLLHEFGHALACRQVGGKADYIVLWPLGGIAYVAPPPRPGAVLWSIAAGPLVNVVLVPATVGLCAVSQQAGWPDDYPDLARMLQTLTTINLVLLIFNMLPVYPLDGGQIVQALLWFVIGRANSLQVVSVIGVIGAVGFGLLAWNSRDWWFAILAVFIGMRAVSGFQQANLLRQRLALPRRPGLACPSCGQAPLQAPVWRCGRCGTPFDFFATQGQCPQCGERYPKAACPECGQLSPVDMWFLEAVPPATMANAPVDDRGFNEGGNLWRGN